MSPWSRETVVALLAVVLLSASLLAVLGGPVTATQSDTQVSPLEDDIGTNWTMAVQLQENGDAVWTISTTIPLTSADERDGFREIATAFEDGDESVFGLSAFERASTQASDATGREMDIVNETRLTATEAEIENGTGRLAVQFRWTNFARVEDDRLHVDDVLVTETGLWLPRLGSGDQLVIRPPNGYGVLQANVVPGQNATLRWTGPTEFDETSLAATFIGNGGSTDDDTDDVPDDTGNTTDDGPNGPSGMASLLPWLVGSLAVLAAIAIGAYFATQGTLSESTTDDTGATVEEPSETADSPPPVTGETSVDAVEETTDTTEESLEEDEDDVDVELLSDEERVTRLLEQNGGRMKQATIVKETDWSNAKVSQLLSSMEDEDKIDKLRIGRENLISFPEEDVTDINDE